MSGLCERGSFGARARLLDCSCGLSSGDEAARTSLTSTDDNSERCCARGAEARGGNGGIGDVSMSGLCERGSSGARARLLNCSCGLSSGDEAARTTLASPRRP
eukprot:1148052-Prymnesium_polylepis.1